MSRRPTRTHLRPDQLVAGGSKRGRVNLLNWDGKGKPGGLFPKQKDDE